MAYKVSKLITNAFYLSGIVSRSLETVSNDQIGDGLDILNDILGDKGIDQALIPYVTKHELTTSPDTEEYFIDNLIDIYTISFFIDSIRYQMTLQKRHEYFASYRNVDITSLPFAYHYERENGGTRLFVYFKPDQSYPVDIYGVFQLSDVKLSDDLAQTYDRYYINYLRYELARRLCIEYAYEVPPMIERQYQTYYEWVRYNSQKIDLTQNTLSQFSAKGAINYAVANLSEGWSP